MHRQDQQFLLAVEEMVQTHLTATVKTRKMSSVVQCTNNKLVTLCEACSEMTVIVLKNFTNHETWNTHVH